MTEALVDTTPAVEGRVAIAVVDPDDAVRAVLLDHVRPMDEMALSFEHLDDFLKGTDPLSPVVLVVGPSEGPDTLIPHTREVVSMRPTCGVVMVVFELTPPVLQQALRAGIDDVVAVSAEDEELADAISRVANRLLARAPSAGEASPRPVEPEPTVEEGKIVTVFCAKGGAGKSVIATNLAVALAQRASKPVVLVDADLQFGDVALMLQLQPTHTIAEAVAAGDRLDSALLGSLLLKHEPSGLLVLAAPTEPGPADHIGKADLSRVLQVLRAACSYIVVDTSSNFGEITLAALLGADEILVVASLDVMSLKAARVGLQTMRVLGIPFSRIKFVLNRANTEVGLSGSDAEKALQLKVDAALPSDLVVAASVNKGTPVVLGAPRSKFARSIEDLVAKLAARVPSAGRQG